MAIQRQKPSNGRDAVARPAVSSVYEKDGQVILLMEMPGVSKENLDIHIEENQLIVHGEVENSLSGTYRLRERKNGPFHMAYTIDETIDREKVEASIKDGILSVVLDRKETEKPRRIQVKVG